MDPDQFAKWASAAQSIVTSIGIIAGGLWVLFPFWNLRLMHRSRAEIAEIEQRAVEQPVLLLAMTGKVAVLAASPPQARCRGLRHHFQSPADQRANIDAVVVLAGREAGGRGGDWASPGRRAASCGSRLGMECGLRLWPWPE
jgi:hypothetical protein